MVHKEYHCGTFKARDIFGTVSVGNTCASIVTWRVQYIQVKWNHSNGFCMLGPEGRTKAAEGALYAGVAHKIPLPADYSVIDIQTSFEKGRLVIVVPEPASAY